jgi:hypothetical protein
MAGYNGWTNYETWNLKLWLDNDQASYQHWQHVAREAFSVGDVQKAKRTLAEQLETHITAVAGQILLSKNLEALILEDAPLLIGFYSDILHASIREVNYWEIAQSMLDDLQEDN